ncbi:RNA polymerase II transcription factor-like protein [Lophiotrema nucula]|uniref:RNA polymerase II transcription factor-like protein n=1 Tax=Lophiotrema nucula TaxID=690887 RepID=A0A6A5ZAB8_9PLEO|nr:RNA polymerase II transcription factor-like protein [Lophiotrema nucula]
MSEASAQYKKQDGTLVISIDGRTVSWKHTEGKAPPVSIVISEITNLQQTPAHSAKASIRIAIQKPGAPQPDAHTFTFTSPKARDDQAAITASLRKWIEAAKAPPPPAVSTPRAENGDSGPSASMTMAQTAAGSTVTESETYDDSRLLRDPELQKSLLNSSPALRQRFEQAIKDKPETITISQLATQFWAARVHLLRSHAAEKAQNQGTYNVLSVVKPKHVDGAMKLNMTKEQIQLIFAQHPLIKRVYNENVPPMGEGDFWSRFFNSRLCKKLKGLKINEELDQRDSRLDLYLNKSDDTAYEEQMALTAVPHYIDLEGNEQNHSQRLGNRPDLTMRPNTVEKVPILRVLNRMSEKLMADVPPSDGTRHGPVGVDEETYNELQLRDLQRAAEDNRVVLNVKDQGQMFSAEQSLHTSSSASAYAKRTPSQVLSLVQKDFAAIAGGKPKSAGIHLESAIGVHDESSSDEEPGTKKKKVAIGSRSARTAATSQIMTSIKKRHVQDDDYLQAQNIPSAEQARKLGLSQEVFDTLSMTHNTTVEFLHYFWSVFLSGDPDRANEAQRLAESLAKSLERIEMVANQAESERNAKVQQFQRENDNYTQRTGKKRKFDPSGIPGGKKVVNEILHPLTRALRAAAQQYQTAYKEQQRQLGQ